MEEIIASISRIIAEDKQPGVKRSGDHRPADSVRPVSVEKSDILELTDAISEDGSVRRITPVAGGTAAPSPSLGAPTEATAADPAVRSHAEPSHAGAGLEPRLDLGRDRIVSAATSGAAAAAFAQLGALPRERRRDGEVSPGGTERTLDEIVREMLRPMLQAWLDQHLLGIVERLVREEIARVVGEAGLR
jgi:uncharacterized protein